MSYQEKKEWYSIGEILDKLNANPVNLPTITSDYFKSLQSLKVYYQENEAAILARPHKWFISYPVDWYSILTPIEMRVWEAIRYVGRVIMYPQYPVLNYFVDFGNPYYKIAIEADGKDYHIDKDRDNRRDQELLNEGWKVFRISGAKINYMPEPLLREIIFEEGYDEYQEQWYKSTLEGFITAFRTIYFDQTRDEDETYLALQVLNNHKSIDFKI